MKHILSIALLFCGLLTYADFQLDVPAGEDPGRIWTLTPDCQAQVGKKIFFKEDGSFQTSESNVFFMQPAEFANGVVALSFIDRYRSNVGVVGRADANHDRYYMLEVTPSRGKGALSRVIPGGDGFRKEFDYDGGKEVRLELVFDGKTIEGKVNGETVVSVPDDGKIPRGHAGVRGTYWTNVIFKSFSFHSAIPAKNPEKPREAMRVEGGALKVNLAEKRDWNLARTTVRTSGMRSEVSLNQLWEFQPVAKFGTAPQDAESEWGFFCVPGYWAQGALTNHMLNREGEPLSVWRGFEPGKGGIAAWYRRTFTLPEAWRDKHLDLMFEDVMGRMEVFWNGRKIGEKTDPGIGNLRIDLAGIAAFGRETTLSVENGNRKSAISGLGNVYLELAPEQTLGKVFLNTSVANKSLRLDFAGDSVPSGSRVAVTVRDGTGKELLHENRAFDRQLTFSWRPPVLWTPDTPELYSLSAVLLDAAGNRLDEFSTPFGFREFSVKGGDFLLNGNPIVLKAETAVWDKDCDWILNSMHNPDEMESRFRAWKALGLNAGYLGENPSEETLRLADRLGVMLLVKGRMFSHEELDEDFDNVMRRLDARLKVMSEEPRYRNHASIIGFLIDVWYGYNAGCTNPNYLGRAAGDPNLQGIPKLRSERLNKMEQVYRSRFPELVPFTGGSGAVGAVYGTHIYHTWGAPSTELRAMFEGWNADRRMPVFIGETYLPYLGSFYDLRDFHGGENYSAENVARLFGNEGYAMGVARTRRPFHATENKDSWYWNSSEKRAGGGDYGFEPEGFQRVTAAFLDEILPGWRFHRLTGAGFFDYTDDCFAAQRRTPPNPNYTYDDFGFKPDVFSDGNAREPVADPAMPDGGLRPTLLYAPFVRAIADRSIAVMGDKEDPLLQDHSGFSGETLKKSLMIFNDTPQNWDGTLTMALKSAGRTIRFAPRELRANPYEHLLVPLDLELPEVGDREDWTLELSFSGLRSVFPLQVFARRPAPILRSKVRIFDPEGKLAAALVRRGIAFEPLSSLSPLPDDGILIIGRNALAKILDVPDFADAARRGLRILVMEQGPESSSELLKSRTRRVFRQAPAHPVFSGLTDADFAFWKGSHSLAEAYRKDGGGVNWSDWGNRNMVAAYVFRRPSFGNAKTLLSSGFDLFQSPLLEYRRGKGVLYCSELDMTERLGMDPVPTRLFENLLLQLDRPGEKSRTVYLAGPEADAFVRKFKLDAEAIAAPDSRSLAEASTLLLIAPDPELLTRHRAALADFAYFGGNVLTIIPGREFRSSGFPFPVKLGEQAEKPVKALVHGTPDSIWRNGWDAGELYWRNETELPVFAEYPPGFDTTSPSVLLRGKFGAGNFLFTTLVPERFQGAAQGKAVRLLSALFASLGVEMKDEFTPFPSKQIAETLDLSEYKWEFATDEKNIGLREGWQQGKGSGKWLKGLIADGVEVRIGQPFESFLRHDYNGTAWYRLNFDAPAALSGGKKLFFSAGAIDDTDEVFLNGVRIGATGRETPSYWKARRNYAIPPGVLKEHGNLLCIRVIDEKGPGGIVEGPVQISERPLNDANRLWTTPYPGGTARDYEYPCDIVRMY